jgi:nucleotide-binding universal stress UspA family protein
MYRKILVPLDGSNFSEQVLPYAHVFADAYRAPVELLRITDPDARPPFWPPQPDDRYLEEIAAQHFRSSVHVTTVAAIGKPAEVIVDHAKDDPSCLIAMATHGLSGPRRWLIGSVASKVIQTAANPLLLIRPIEGADFAAPVRLDTVFVPLDGSGSGGKNSAARLRACEGIESRDSSPARVHFAGRGLCDRGRRDRSGSGSVS